MEQEKNGYHLMNQVADCVNYGDNPQTPSLESLESLFSGGILPIGRREPGFLGGAAHEEFSAT